MTNRTFRPLGSLPRALVLALVLASGQVSRAATEVPPTQSHHPVLVVTGSSEDVYYPLAAGAQLSYDAAGPSKLTVRVRRRLAVGQDHPPQCQIVALGDGHLIMKINVTKGPDRGATIYDSLGGLPSRADVAHITVPPGGKVLTLTAPAGGPDFLVRVEREETEGAVASAPATSAPTAAPGEGAPEARSGTGEALAGVEAALAALSPTSESQTGDSEAAGTSTSANDDQLAAGDLEPAGDEVGASEPTSAEALGTKDSEGAATSSTPPLERPGRSLGSELGVGVPMRGQRAVIYVGARSRWQVLPEPFSLSGAIGFYRIGVYQELPVTDPYLGSFRITESWVTNVIPLSVEGLVEIPGDWGAGVQPIAGAGPVLQFAWRTTEAGTTGGMALGARALGGIEMSVGRGNLVSTLSFNMARRRFGNIGIDGGPVRESLGTIRLNAAWLLPF